MFVATRARVDLDPLDMDGVEVKNDVAHQEFVSKPLRRTGRTNGRRPVHSARGRDAGAEQLPQARPGRARRHHGVRVDGGGRIGGTGAHARTDEERGRKVLRKNGGGVVNEAAL